MVFLRGIENPLKGQRGKTEGTGFQGHVHRREEKGKKNRARYNLGLIQQTLMSLRGVAGGSRHYIRKRKGEMLE